MSITIPEPSDTSIVGWGHPITVAYVRDDEGANDAGYDDGDPWFDVVEGGSSIDGPVRWETLCTKHAEAGDGDPYLLVPTPLESR